MISQIILILSTLANVAVAAAPRSFTTVEWNDLINARFLPEFNAAVAKSLIVTKIEMVTNHETFGSHWMARLTTKRKDNTPGPLLSAERNTIRERWTAWDPEGKKHKEYKHVNAELNNPKIDGADVTVYHIMECVSAVGLDTNTGKCWLYVYRMLQFAKGCCPCGECIPKPAGDVKTGDAALIAAAVKLTQEDTCINANFKWRVEIWKDLSGCHERSCCDK